MGWAAVGRWAWKNHKGFILSLVAGGLAAVVFLLGLPEVVSAVQSRPKPDTSTSCTNPQQTQPVSAIGTTAAGLNSDQLHNAGLIIAIGHQLGVPVHGWVVALSAAMQESKLLNLDRGDIMANGEMSTSRGLFQMIASTAAEAGVSNEDPVADIHWFYGQLQNVSGWQDMSVAMAAEAVEHSGVPDAYAQWETLADQLVRNSHLGKGAGTTAQDASTATAATVCPADDTTIPVDASGKVGVAEKAAVSMVGKPYCWGGGGPEGPSEGIPTNGPHPGPNGLSPGCDSGHPGFDCSGLTQYAYAQAGVAIGGDTSSQINDGQQISQDQLQPGDLVFPDSGHVVMYLGHGMIVEAPQDGETVHVRPYYGMWRAVRVVGRTGS